MRAQCRVSIGDTRMHDETNIANTKEKKNSLETILTLQSTERVKNIAIILERSSATEREKRKDLA